jgi:hypothetical protein
MAELLTPEEVKVPEHGHPRQGWRASAPARRGQAERRTKWTHQYPSYNDTEVIMLRAG